MIKYMITKQDNMLYNLCNPDRPLIMPNDTSFVIYVRDEKYYVKFTIAYDSPYREMHIKSPEEYKFNKEEIKGISNIAKYDCYIPINNKPYCSAVHTYVNNVIHDININYYNGV